MLTHLQLRDLVIVDEAELDFGPGLTALTGETGAGKSIVVDALLLIAGGRGGADIVRQGAERAEVAASFAALPDAAVAWLEAQAIEHNGEVIVRRVIGVDGRSRAYVNGQMVPIQQLREFAEFLIEVHGQQEFQHLVKRSAQREMLDEHLDQPALPGVVAEIHDRFRGCRRDYDSLKLAADDRESRLDLLRYQLAEIDAAALEDPDEDVTLAEEEDRLAEAAAHREAAATALAALDSGDAGRGAVVDLLGVARAALDGRGPLATLAGRLAGLQADASDAASELRHVVETWEDDPVRLEQVRTRRHLLRELARKYGEGSAGVLAFAEEARRRVGELDSAEERAGTIRAQLETVAAEVAVAEATVGAMRRRAAPKLAAAVEERLRSLAMPQARLEVTVAETDPGDDVTILLGANPGEAVLPLAKVASGGELARAMLALRLVLTDAPPTMVFDEVDAGVGGEAAQAVGRALAEVAERHQVLVVTHLAQVAACAGCQLGVHKDVADGRTVAQAAVLSGDDRVVELARMLSGRPGSATARRHAEELLESSIGTNTLHR